MGYYMEQFDQAFRISAENKAAAFEALKGWALKEMERNAAYAHLGHSPIGDATELEEALSELDWETSTDDCGNIVEMCFSGEKLHDEDEWLDAIAPHVDKGSQLMMRGEDGCSWCWYFDGESCTTYLGEVIFPDMPDDGKESIYTHDEAALIVEEFETVLEKYGVKIPSPEDDEREKDNGATLYGSTYSDLLDSVENMLIDLLERHAEGTGVVKYTFSGKIRLEGVNHMAESDTRIFRDQRYPDQLISLEQLKKEYGEQIADGSIDPDELSFTQHLFNCMDSQGGTLSEVLPELEKKGSYPFMIRETLTLNVSIEADSFEEAQRLVEAQYGNGEFDLDRNCFAGAEFRPCCSKCESDYDEDDNDLREINEGTPMAMMLCNRCVADMEDCGTLTRCECCEDLFSPARLKINPENGLQEICPLCGEVWCE